MPHSSTLERIRAEYLEMPGLNLTLSQVQRLCGVDRAPCEAVLDALVEAKFLHVRPDGTYVRLTEGEIPRAQRVRASVAYLEEICAVS
jgi:DNA-binding IclR family transcriptional regulator